MSCLNCYDHLIINIYETTEEVPPNLKPSAWSEQKLTFLGNQKLTLSLTLFLYLDESELQPVYGGSLEDHLRIQEREIAFVIEECVTFLYRTAMSVQVSPLFILLFVTREQNIYIPLFHVSFDFWTFRPVHHSISYSNLIITCYSYCRAKYCNVAK